MLNNFLSLNSGLNILLVLVFGFFVFVAIRELLTWYWKINRIETLLERIERNTRKEGVKYPDDDYDEVYLKRNGLEAPEVNKTE
jgi:hypothetical protein